MAPLGSNGTVQGRGYTHFDHGSVGDLASQARLVSVGQQLGGLAV